MPETPIGDPIPKLAEDGLRVIDIRAADDLLSTTRAVRRRLDLDRPVEREVLMDCVRLALQAPAALNSQAWRFVIITDSGTRLALADIYRRAGAVKVDSPLRGMPEGPQKKVTEDAQRFMAVLGRVPVHVLACTERPLEGQPLPVQMSVLGSVLPAIWSFQLALRSRGLGSVFTTLHLWHADQAAELLGLPEGVTQVALIPVAYTLGTDFRPARRAAPEEAVFWNSWGTDEMRDVLPGEDHGN